MIPVHIATHISYIYIYRERERETETDRERERERERAYVRWHIVWHALPDGVSVWCGTLC